MGDWIIQECVEWIQVCTLVGTIACGAYYGSSGQPNLERVQRFCKTLVWICVIITLLCCVVALLILNWYQPALAG